MRRYFLLDHDSRMKVCREFVADLYEEETHYNAPRCMTPADADYNIRCYLQEGREVPADLTAAMFCDLWNHMVWDDLTADG